MSHFASEASITGARSNSVTMFDNYSECRIWILNETFSVIFKHRAHWSNIFSFLNDEIQKKVRRKKTLSLFTELQWFNNLCDWLWRPRAECNSRSKSSYGGLDKYSIFHHQQLYILTELCGKMDGTQIGINLLSCQTNFWSIFTPE